MSRDYSQRFVETEGTYLLSHSVGLQPRSARQAVLDDFFEPWARGETAWDGWLAQITRFREAIARLLSTSPAALLKEQSL